MVLWFVVVAVVFIDCYVSTCIDVIYVFRILLYDFHAKKFYLCTLDSFYMMARSHLPRLLHTRINGTLTMYGCHAQTRVNIQLIQR